jgi:hypothetical protein
MVLEMKFPGLYISRRRTTFVLRPWLAIKTTDSALIDFPRFSRAYQKSVKTEESLCRLTISEGGEAISSIGNHR